MSPFLERILVASLQGGLYAGGVWVVSRLFPKLPGAARATLFWCAAASFALTLCWPAPIALPVLPPRELPPQVSVYITSASRGILRELRPTPPPEATVWGATADRASQLGRLDSALRAVDWSALLGGLWAAGVALQLAALGLQLLRARRAVLDAEPLEEGPAPELLEALCDQLGLSRRPALLVSPDASSPQLVGLFKPSILLPADGLDDVELRLALAHELHHLKRRDLWLGLLPGAVRALFFFHPLAWLVHREYLVSRELACDASVLALRGASPRAYGRLLLRLATGHAWLGASSAAAAPTFPVLKRRLSMLDPSLSSSRRWPAILVGLAALLLVPIRLVAQPAAAAPAEEDEAGRPSDDVRTARGSGSARGTGVSRAGAEESEDRARAVEDRERELEERARVAEDRARQLEDRARQAEDRAIEAEARAQRTGRSADRGARKREQEAERDAKAIARDAERVARRSSRLAVSSSHGGGDSEGEVYALIDGDHTIMSGTTRDLEQARREAAKVEGPSLYFRHQGRAFLLTDPALVGKARALFAPQEALGKQQAALGEQQAELGGKQAALGEQQATLGAEMARLSMTQARTAVAVAAGHDDERAERDREAIDRQMTDLGDRMGKLGEQQAELGERQTELGDQQGKLGEEQGRLAQDAEVQLRKLLDDARARGLAKPLP